MNRQERRKNERMEKKNVNPLKSLMDNMTNIQLIKTAEAL
jgi:hypothetical protein